MLLRGRRSNTLRLVGRSCGLDRFYWEQRIAGRGTLDGCEGKSRYVDVADGRNEEGGVQADVVGDDSLQLGDDGSTEDGSDQDARSFAGERAEVLDA